jgi:hypothetical protein
MRVTDRGHWAFHQSGGDLGLGADTGTERHAAVELGTGEIGFGSSARNRADCAWIGAPSAVGRSRGGDGTFSARERQSLAACRRNEHFAKKSGNMKQYWPVILAK